MSSDEEHVFSILAERDSSFEQLRKRTRLDPNQLFAVLERLKQAGQIETYQEPDYRPVRMRSTMYRSMIALGGEGKP